MTSDQKPNISIPPQLLPADGRFGSGPSKVRQEAVTALASAAPGFLGTSHRQKTVRNVVHELREGLRDLFALPEGYEVVLGNGGATVFWDVATFGLIEKRSQHLVFGEFSSKFASGVAAAPFLDAPEKIDSPSGTHPEPEAHDGIDSYAFTHNETSTGVAMPILRPEGAAENALVLVDATSAAGGIPIDPRQFDVYYFAPQKCFASDGGLWVALCSPRALERAAGITASGRWIPTSIDFSTALGNSTKDQTYNTPALATLYLFNQQVKWVNNNGGMDFASGRSARSAETLYGWAEACAYASPFVQKPDQRSPVVGTIDLDDSIDATDVSATLRDNGIVDTDAYRKLGRNQLRIAMFPAIDPEDISALTRCVDYVVEQLKT